jgi:indole-3-glycerol phosphate synthase
MDILDKIIANKRLEVERQKAAVPLDRMFHTEEWRLQRPAVSMRRALESSSSGIISEFKRRSPSKGWLHPEAGIDHIVPGYEKGGASACSILTDGDFFGGSFADLKRARELTRLPLLRKDFIIDEYQIYQAHVMGADAVLLIAASLTKEECRSFAAIAHRLELEVLLEIHDEKELAFFTGDIDMLGVNNRNLGTFHTDVENSFRMIKRMKAETGGGRQAPVFISESGIADTETIRKLRDAGYRGFLIGETFMKTDDPAAALAGFIRELNHG